MELTTLVVVGTCSSRYTMTSADDYCKNVLHAEKPQNGLSEPVIRRTENTMAKLIWTNRQTLHGKLNIAEQLLWEDWQLLFY
jgi:hypothetical protein